MPSMKAIKRRIASIKSTHHIMKAMNLVAASKLQKQKIKLDAIRPMFSDIEETMKAVASHEEAGMNVYFAQRDVKNVAYILITSDRGLCGGYNTNVSKEAISAMKANEGKEEFILTVGSKGADYLRRRGKNAEVKIAGASDSATIYDAEFIGKTLVEKYLKGEVDEIHVVYTRFNSVLSHEPTSFRLLPIRADEEAAGGHKNMTYDPDITGFLEHAVPMYLNTFLYGAMVESAVCEWAARMTSMDAAQNNAEEIIGDLTLVYNRKRQGMITQEINEIVGGANAV